MATKDVLEGPDSLLLQQLDLAMDLLDAKDARIDSLPVYANNAAAVTGGLAVGRFYRTGGDPDLVAVVH